LDFYRIRHPLSAVYDRALFNTNPLDVLTFVGSTAVLLLIVINRPDGARCTDLRKPAFTRAFLMRNVSRTTARDLNGFSQLGLQAQKKAERVGAPLKHCDGRRYPHSLNPHT